ncbi:transmembrane protein, putative (macronuclear) [Tetrahymena thermophila SB210]|uniref:Transmembrane protein, putative n=1 Tax=Tetrahymena thermophila (strain SB210) TaxID=312017 RepID=W7XJS8_TETTS|nr:transmembrane protein, putative [Tetrahymena thermophila SB210]EWS75911.1 transmembrane protein, putative [Tetrahymena thermophila SB210]|eukprot:XP_012651554.1 transmembrane protein, putative [Tetrahymena thermophila SB210]
MKQYEYIQSKSLKQKNELNQQTKKQINKQKQHKHNKKERKKSNINLINILKELAKFYYQKNINIWFLLLKNIFLLLFNIIENIFKYNKHIITLYTYNNIYSPSIKSNKSIYILNQIILKHIMSYYSNIFIFIYSSFFHNFMIKKSKVLRQLIYLIYDTLLRIIINY